VLTGRRIRSSRVDCTFLATASLSSVFGVDGETERVRSGDLTVATEDRSRAQSDRFVDTPWRRAEEFGGVDGLTSLFP
jgi:hypothetical protein